MTRPFWGEEGLRDPQTGRVAYLDIAKAIGILRVIWYHTNVAPKDYLALFGMPMFFFISGIFIKPERDAKTFVRSKMHTIVAPFLVFFAISFVIELLVYKMEHWHWEGYFTFAAVHNAPLWFLLTLLYASVMLYTVEHLQLRTPWRVALHVAISLIGWVLAVKELHLPLMLSQAFLIYPIMLAGYLLRDLLTSGRIFCPLTLLLVVLGIVWSFARYNFSNFHHLIISPHYFPPMLKAMAWTGGILYLAMLLSLTRWRRLLVWVGGLTLLVLGLHMFILGPLREANHIHGWIPEHFTGWHPDMFIGLLVAVVILAITLCLGLLLRRLLPRIFK